jgi:SAM-dependent methyltransferase
VLTADFIQELHCPYCGSGLAIERVVQARGDHIEHGILRCGCYHYPIIDGILILKQQSGPADTHDVRVAYLRAGQIENARHHAMYVDAPLASRPARWRGLLESGVAGAIAAARTLLRLQSTPASNRDAALTHAPFASSLETLRPGLYAQYLYQRYANNSFLASVPPLLLLGDLVPGQRVLELACGIGHSAFLMQALFPHLSLVATDHDFVNLAIAKRYFATDAQLVCIDAEAPLPFLEGSFAAVFCLDGFHYLRSKVALVKELNRITQTEALWLFPHLHNARAENFNPGIPLEPEQYAHCFADVPHRLFRESALLSDFHHEGALRLDHAPIAEDLAQAPNLTLIGTRRPDFWRVRTDLAVRLASRPRQLIVNPIYRVEADAAVTRLTLSWPSLRLQDECREVEDYLPRSCNIDSALLQRLRGDELAGTDLQAVQDLTRRFVLVNLPLAAYPPG